MAVRGPVGRFLAAMLVTMSAGCDPDEPGVPSAAEDAAQPSAVESGPDMTPDASVPPAVPSDVASSDPRAAVSKPAATEPTPTQAPRNTVVRVTLSAQCTLRGDTLVATIHAPPKAGLSMIVTYEDSHGHTQMDTGTADEHGRYVWTVRVPSTVPPGEGTVLASGTGPEHDRDMGGSGEAKFRVAEAVC
jgi:hypothetical protein